MILNSSGSRRFVGVGVSLALGVVWLGLAHRSPTTTYHLLPAAVAAGWPLALHRSQSRPSLPVALRAGAGGVAVAAAAIVVLVGLDALRGPALVGDSAVGESVIAAVAGAALAVRSVGRDRTAHPSVQRAHAHQTQDDQEEPDRQQHE